MSSTAWLVVLPLVTKLTTAGVLWSVSSGMGWFGNRRLSSGHLSVLICLYGTILSLKISSTSSLGMILTQVLLRVHPPRSGPAVSCPRPSPQWRLILPELDSIRRSMSCSLQTSFAETYSHTCDDQMSYRSSSVEIRIAMSTQWPVLCLCYSGRCPARQISFSSIIAGR